MQTLNLSTQRTQRYAKEFKNEIGAKIKGHSWGAIIAGRATCLFFLSVGLYWFSLAYLCVLCVERT